MTHATDIVAYSFQGDTYHPGCIMGALPTGPGGAYDGWASANTVPMPVEQDLSQIAYAFGIDRADESSFDSGDFPKVVFSSQVEGDEFCGACLAPID